MLAPPATPHGDGSGTACNAGEGKFVVYFPLFCVEPQFRLKAYIRSI